MDSVLLRKCKDCGKDLPVEVFNSKTGNVCRPCAYAKNRAKSLRAKRERDIINTTVFRVCSQCGSSKAIEEFRRDPKSKKWIDRRSICRSCESETWRIQRQKRLEKQQQAYTENLLAMPWKERVKFVRQHQYLINIKNQYGVVPERYKEIHDSQKGKCAICGLPESEESGMLMVDHDHVTGLVRGLLCRQCNFGLGLFRDNSAILSAAIKYLKSFTWEM